MEYRLVLEAFKMEADSLLRVADTRPLAQIAFPVMHRALIAIVSDTFAAEGSPTPWAPLAEFTISERLWLGFDEGPILHRTGSLRASFTDEHHPLHIGEMTLHPLESTMRVGSVDPRAVKLSGGDVETNLPSRPIMPDGTLIFPEMQAYVDYAGEALYG